MVQDCIGKVFSVQSSPLCKELLESHLRRLCLTLVLQQIRLNLRREGRVAAGLLRQTEPLA